ncbi:MAG: hypothetical protein R6X02_01600 [Enhygromyxa sp.]
MLLAPGLAVASEPNDAPDSDSPASSSFELEPPSLLAYAPGPAALLAPVPIYAKRSRERSFDTSSGERDPRARQRPRTHRFRLAFHAQYLRLSKTEDQTGEVVRFHFAPLMLDLAYQAQFLKFMMARLALGVGANLANTKQAMPIVVYPQAYLGYQGKIFGLAFGYGFDWTIPPNYEYVDVTLPRPKQVQQPVIARNHVVKGELSLTSRVDRVALTFALAIGGIRSDLSHYDTNNRKWRTYFGLQAGVFFDGSIRRDKKARQKAEAEGR